jgi:predicted permease
MPHRPAIRKKRFRPYFWLIAMVSLIVPRRLRSQWRREWQAELQHRESLLDKWQRLDWKAKLDLLRHSAGSLRDALWLQRWRLEEEMFQDIRYGIRMLINSPGFTAVAVLSLVLGIGANTAIFSLINAVVLKTLPVRDPEQLILLGWVSGPNPPAASLRGNLDMRGGGSSSTSFSYPAFEQMRARNEVFSDMVAFTDLDRLNVSIDGQAELNDGQIVSGNYYSVLGVEPALGRLISDEDDRQSEAAAAVISYAYWQRRFGQNPEVLGKVIYLNGAPFTIIGVTPPAFNGTLQVGYSPEITVPLAMQPLVLDGKPIAKDSTNWWLQILGRLKPGVTEEQARGQLNTLFQQIVAADLTTFKEEKDEARLEVSAGSRGLNDTRRQISETLFIMMGVVGLVLAIACANIANLLLARSAARQKEIAVRLALGASRFRLIRQLLTESVLLAVVGGSLGLLLTYWSRGFLLQLVPAESAGMMLDLEPDVRILAFTVSVSIVTGLLFGIAPAFRATKVDLTPALKDNDRVTSRARSRLSKVLLVGQVAISLMLLISAGLFVRTLQNLEKVTLGFNRENLLIFKVDPTLNGYKGARLANLYRQMEEKIEAIPGVRSVSLSRYPLISNSASITSVSVPGFTPPSDKKIYVYLQPSSEDFLDTMEIPLLAGRNIRSQDGEGAPKVAVVNETFARTFFSGADPVGRRFSFHRSKTEIEIVGLARDAKYSYLRDETPPTIYLPYLQDLPRLGQMTFEVRTAGEPFQIVPFIRQAVQSLDSGVPLFNVKTQSEIVAEHLSEERMFARLSSAFGLLALLLACIGLYGIMSYAVTRRTHEIGIRMALGARPGNVRWMVMRETVLLVLIGVVIGVVAAVWATELISSLLFGLTGADPLTIACVAMLLIAVSAFAGYLPARRASRVDPIVALRYE